MNAGDLQVLPVDFTTVGTKMITVTYEGKTATFDIIVEEPINYSSKTIQSLDFSTVYATQAQAKLVSKPVTVGDFTGNRKDFTIVINGERIPIYISWALSTDFTKGASMGSVVDSHIQDYFFQKDGVDGIMNRTVTAFGFDDTFQISTFQTGSTAAFTLEGADWSYFFDQSSAQGTNDDTSKNRTFTIADGANTVAISLTSKYTTIDQLITLLNNRLRDANIQAQATKVDGQHFQITTTAADVNLVFAGADKNSFFD